MNTLVLDDCLMALYEAQEISKHYVEMSSYQEIFEANNPDVSQQMQNNAKVVKNTDNALVRAIRAIKKMISNVVGSIKNFIAELTMSKDERNMFEQFKEAMAKDPSLANKKISVSDFRQIHAEYQNRINQIEQKIKEVEANPKTPIDDLVKQITGFLSGGAKSAGTIVVAQVAQRMAMGNVNIARGISKALEFDMGIMNTLEQELGAKDAKKFKKRVEAAGKKLSLYRLKCSIFNKEYQSLTGCLNSVKGAFEDLMHGKINANNAQMVKQGLQNDNIGKPIKQAGKQIAKGMVNGTKKNFHDKTVGKAQKWVDNKINGKKGQGANKGVFGFITGR